MANFVTREEFNNLLSQERASGGSGQEAVNYVYESYKANNGNSGSNSSQSNSNQYARRNTYTSPTKTWNASSYKGNQQQYNRQYAAEALRSIAKTTTDKQLAKLINKHVGSGSKKDNFWGQTKSSFDIGKISELSNQAWGKYAESRSDADKAIADAYDLLAEYYQDVNAEALDDKNVKAKWISQDMARYAPQFIEQTKAGGPAMIVGAGIGAGLGAAAGALIPTVGEEAATTSAGAMAGRAIGGAISKLSGGLMGKAGGLVAGTKAGAVAGSYNYSYDTMRGAAMRSLLESGVDFESAQAASRDEAIISSAIESLDTGVDLFLMIPGLGNVTKAAAKNLLGGLTKVAIPEALKVIGSYGANVGGEGLEEFSQEIISIANLRRIKSGNLDSGIPGLISECQAVLDEIVKQTGDGKTNLQQALEAARGGAVIGGFMAPIGAVINNVITSPAQNAIYQTVNNFESDPVAKQINSEILNFQKNPGQARAAQMQFEQPGVGDKLYTANENMILFDRDNKPIGVVPEGGRTEQGLLINLYGGPPVTVIFSENSGLISNGDVVSTLANGGYFANEAQFLNKGDQAPQQNLDNSGRLDTIPTNPSPRNMSVEERDRLYDEMPFTVDESPREQAERAAYNKAKTEAQDAFISKNKNLVNRIKNVDTDTLRAQISRIQNNDPAYSKYNESEKALLLRLIQEELSLRESQPQDTSSQPQPTFTSEPASQPQPESESQSQPTFVTESTEEKTAPENKQSAETPSEELATALGEATAKETTNETQSDENLSPAEKFYRENPGKKTYETTLKDGQKVKITKGKDGYTVRVKKPRVDGTGYTTKDQVLGTVKTIAEANQLVKDAKKATPTTGNAIADASTKVPTKAKKPANTEEWHGIDASKATDDELDAYFAPDEQSTKKLLKVREEVLNSDRTQKDKDAILEVIDKELSRRNVEENAAKYRNMSDSELKEAIDRLEKDDYEKSRGKKGKHIIDEELMAATEEAFKRWGNSNGPKAKRKYKADLDENASDRDESDPHLPGYDYNSRKGYNYGMTPQLLEQREREGKDTVKLEPEEMDAIMNGSDVELSRSMAKLDGEPLTAEEVADLKPVQVIQRLLNRAKEFGFHGLKNFSKKYTDLVTRISLNSGDFGFLIERLIEEGTISEDSYGDNNKSDNGEGSTGRQGRSVEVDSAVEKSIRETRAYELFYALKNALKQKDISINETYLDEALDYIFFKGSDKVNYSANKDERKVFRDYIQKLLGAKIDWNKAKTETALALISKRYSRLSEEVNMELAPSIPDDVREEVDALLDRAKNISLSSGKSISGKTGYTDYYMLSQLLGEDEHENSANMNQYFDYEDLREDPKQDENNDPVALSNEELEKLEDTYFQQNWNKWVNGSWAEKPENTIILSMKDTDFDKETNKVWDYEEEERVEKNLNYKNFQGALDKKGRTWVAKRGQGYLVNIFKSGINDVLNDIYDTHKAKAEKLQSEIKRYEQYLDDHRKFLKNVITQGHALSELPGNFKEQKEVKKYVDGLKAKLDKEQSILDKLDNVGFTDKDPYTVKKLLNDRAFTAKEISRVADAVKRQISDKDVQGFKVSNVRNAVSEKTAFEILRKAREDYYARENVGTVAARDENGKQIYDKDPDTGRLIPRRTPLKGGVRRAGGFGAVLDREENRNLQEKLRRTEEEIRNRYPERSNKPDTKTDGLLQPPQGGNRQEVEGDRGQLTEAQIERIEQSEEAFKARQAEADRIANGRIVKNFYTNIEPGVKGRYIAVREIGDNLFLEEAPPKKEAVKGVNKKTGKEYTFQEEERIPSVTVGLTSDENPSNERLRSATVAETLNAAADELGTYILGINGNLWHRHGKYSTAAGYFLTTDEEGKSTPISGYTEKDRIVLQNIRGENKGSVIRTFRHEAQHKITERMFTGDTADEDKTAFAKKLIKDAGLDWDDSTWKIRDTYDVFDDSADAEIADEVISRIADGEGFGKGVITDKDAEKLYDALTTSVEWQKAVGNLSSLRKVFNTSLASISPEAEDTSGFTPTVRTVSDNAELNKELNKRNMESSQEQRISEAAFYERKPLSELSEKQRKKEQDTGMWSNASVGVYKRSPENAQSRQSDVGLKPAPAKSMDRTGYAKYKMDLDPEPDFGDTAPRDTTKYTSQIYRELDETIQEMYRDDPNKQTADRPKAPIPDEDTFVKEWHRRQDDPKTKLTGEQIFNHKKHKQPWVDMQASHRRIQEVNRRSALANQEAMRKIDNSETAKHLVEDYKALSKMVDGVMDGSRSMTELYHMAENLRTVSGMKQIFSDYVVNFIRGAAQQEQIASVEANNNAPEAIKYRYAAARALHVLSNRIERVDRVVYGDAVKLTRAAKANGKGNPTGAIRQAAQWLNRMQMNGDNFWKMIDGFDMAAHGIGYQMARKHDRANATKITTEARAKSFFTGLEKTKGFNEFVTGKAKGKIDSIINELSLKNTINTLLHDYEYTDKNGIWHRETDWSQLEDISEIQFQDANGKTRSISIDNVDQIKDLYKQVTEDINGNEAAKAYEKAFVKMFADIAPEAGRIATEVYGYDKKMYDEGSYFPVHRAHEDGNTWSINGDTTGVVGTSSFQNRKPDSNAPLLIMPATQVVDQYISQASNFVAYSDFGQDLNLLMDGDGINGSFANTVGNTFGATYGEYFKNYADTINMIRTPDQSGFNRLLGNARARMMQGALLGSVSVPIKQISSYWAAMGVVDPRAVVRAFRPKLYNSEHRADNNPFAMARRQGSIEQDMSAHLKTDWLSKIRNSIPGGDLLVNATNIMDSRTVNNVYKACIYDVAMNTLTEDQMFKEGGKGELTELAEFYVNSKFQEAVLHTQPIFVRQARNELARSNSEILRMFSTFRTQQTQNYNRLLTTVGEYRAAMNKEGQSNITKAAATKHLRDTVKGQVASAVSISLLTTLANALLHKHKKYEDEEGDVDYAKVFKRIGLDTLETAASTSLFGGELSKWLIDQVSTNIKKANGTYSKYDNDKEFYGISMGAISSVQSVINAVGWYKDNPSVSNARYIVNYTATVLGIPLSNAYSLVNAGVMWSKDIVGDNEGNYDDMLKSLDAARKDYGNQLYNAMRSNNDAKAQKALGNMGDQFLNKIKATSFERLKSGKSDDFEVAQALTMYGGMREDKAYEWINQQHMEIDTGYKYSKLREEWAKGNISTAKAIEYEQTYGNKTKEKAQEELQKWQNDADSEEAYGVQYSKMEDAYLNRELKRSDYIKAVMEYEDKTREEAEAYVSRRDFKAQYGRSYTDLNKMVLNGEISDADAAKWYKKTQDKTDEQAETWLERYQFQRATGYEANWRSSSDLYDSYSSNEKMGIMTFYNTYGNQFKSAKQFGKVFNELNNVDRTDWPTYHNPNGYDATQNQARVITQMNNLIKSGELSYDMAHTIWVNVYGWKANNRNAWSHVHK